MWPAVYRLSISVVSYISIEYLLLLDIFISLLSLSLSLALASKLPIGILLDCNSDCNELKMHIRALVSYLSTELLHLSELMVFIISILNLYQSVVRHLFI